jgi:membrane associated rhomboid family serine protease
MGLYDRAYYRDDDRPGMVSGGPRSVVTNLILVNVAIFVVDAFLVKGKLGDLLAVRADTLVRPWLWWQLVTYGFAHDPTNIMHVVGNMLGLFFFGRDVEEVYGPRRFLGFYLAGLVLGSFVWSAKELIVVGPEASVALVGASGAVTAVIVLFALHFPQRTVLFMLVIPMRAWVFGVILVIYNLLGSRTGGRVAYDVHLVGAAFGWAWYATGGALAPGFTAKWLRRRPQLRLLTPDDTQTKLEQSADRVLEKLHREGEASLTRQERQILEDYSRRLRQRQR